MRGGGKINVVMKSNNERKEIEIEDFKEFLRKAMNLFIPKIRQERNEIQTFFYPVKN
jgi:hypothetical protein